MLHVIVGPRRSSNRESKTARIIEAMSREHSYEPSSSEAIRTGEYPMIDRSYPVVPRPRETIKAMKRRKKQ